VTCVSFAPGGRWLAAGRAKRVGDGTVELWDVGGNLTPGSTPRSYEVARQASGVYSVTFHPRPNRLLLASGGGERRVLLTDVTDPSEPQSTWLPETLADPIRALAFSPKGDLLAVGEGADTSIKSRYVQVWALADLSNPVHRLEQTDPITSLAFHPDGDWLASGSYDHQLWLWNLGSRGGPRAWRLGGHNDFVYSVAWSADGNLLASASGDRTVRLWGLDGNLRQRGWLDRLGLGPLLDRLPLLQEELAPSSVPLRGPAQGIHGVSFLPYDTPWVAMASADGTARLRPTLDATLHQHACAVAGRNMYTDDW
jgi:WD40 repeat protein